MKTIEIAELENALRDTIRRVALMPANTRSEWLFRGGYIEGLNHLGHRFGLNVSDALHGLLPEVTQKGEEA